MKRNVDKLYEDMLKAKVCGYKICITLSATAGNDRSYLTPVRLFNGLMLTGAVVHGSKEAGEIASAVEDLAEIIYVDVEKKIIPKFSDGKIETGNILRSVLQSVKCEKKVMPFRPNMLTVSAVLEKITKLAISQQNLKIGVVGLGSIGSRLSRDLVETGFDVIGLPRQIGPKELNLETHINLYKHVGTISDFRLTNTLEKLSLRADVVVLCSTCKNLINEKNFHAFLSKKLILDVGKGNVSSNAAKFLNNIEWLDVGTSLKKFILGDVGFSQIDNFRNRILAGEINFVGSHVKSGEKIFDNDNSSIYPIGEIDENGAFVRFSLDQVLDGRQIQ